MASIYDFTLYDRTGNEYPLANYKGEVMLIVNTATGCGFTPHYEPIEKMYEQYHDKGFEGFGKGVAAMAMRAMAKKMDKDYKNSPDIKWNFTKFLVDREGNVVARFEPTADMKEVEKAVAALI